MSESQPMESRCCEYDGIVLAFFQFAETRIDIPADSLNIEIRPQNPQLSCPAAGTSTDHGTVRYLTEWISYDRVARIFALRYRSEGEALPHLSGQVLQAVN